MADKRHSIQLQLIAFVATCLVAFAAVPAFAADAELSETNGWVESGGQKYWYDNGVMATSKEVYDPGSNAWYWFDADGTMAHDKDAYLPAGDKWVRYDSNGHMIKGEDCRYGGWYFFDEITGAMVKGVTYIVGGDGAKWVYYDVITGQMVHGEACLSYDADHTGWYCFDSVSGAMKYGWQVSGIGAQVHYDETTGIMDKGEAYIAGDESHTAGWYYFDEITGCKVEGWKWLSSNDGKLVFYDPQQQGAMRLGIGTDSYGVTHAWNSVTGALENELRTYSLNITAKEFSNLQGVEETYVASEGSYGADQNLNLLKFADLRRTRNTVTAAQLNAFIESNSTGQSGTLKGHGADILEAADTYGVDAVYLLAHAILESGWGTSDLSSGDWWEAHEFDGESYPAGNYFNYFGWGAYDDNAYASGMNYAQVYGWSTVRDALMGGAKKISSNYICSGRNLTGIEGDASQKTLYEMRFDPQYTLSTGNKSQHQYATDAGWADKIASVMAAFYKNSGVSPDYTYYVPLYANGGSFLS